jgi:hypothetical protein
VVLIPKSSRVHGREFELPHQARKQMQQQKPLELHRFRRPEPDFQGTALAVLGIPPKVIADSEGNPYKLRSRLRREQA